MVKPASASVVLYSIKFFRPLSFPQPATVVIAKNGMAQTRYKSSSI